MLLIVLDMKKYKKNLKGHYEFGEANCQSELVEDFLLSQIELSKHFDKNSVTNNLNLFVIMNLVKQTATNRNK